MDQRSTLRLVYWLVFGCIVLASVSPTAIFDTARPGYFVTYRDDVTMLLIGVVVLAAMAGIGLKI